MRSMKCALSSDLKKLSKTPFFAIHLFTPVVCAALFALYTAVADHSAEAMAVAYFQVIAIAMPVASALVCSLMMQQEMDAGDAYFLLSSPSRTKALLSKFVLAIGAGLVSCLLAAVLFGFSMIVLRGIPIHSLIHYVVAGVIVWACGVALYAIQMWTALKFGRTISIAVASFQSLIAALLLTGIGGAAWYILPPGWGVRISEMYLTSTFGTTLDVAQYVNSALQIASPLIVSITLMLSGIMFVWFACVSGCRG